MHKEEKLAPFKNKKNPQTYFFFEKKKNWEV